MEQPVVFATSRDLQKFAEESPPSNLVNAIRKVVSYLAIHPEIVTQSCIEASASIALELRTGGVECVILEGEVLLEKNSWLEHRLVIVETRERWAIVDLAVSQVPRLRHYEILVVVLAPSPNALRDALETLYAWAD